VRFALANALDLWRVQGIDLAAALAQSSSPFNSFRILHGRRTHRTERGRHSA
jgi:hypothetical protein